MELMSITVRDSAQLALVAPYSSTVQPPKKPAGCDAYRFRRAAGESVNPDDGQT